MTEDNLDQYIFVFNKESNGGLLADNAGIVKAPGIKKSQIIQYDGKKFYVASDISCKKHIAIIDIPNDKPVIVHGVVIGYAKGFINAGEVINNKADGNMLNELRIDGEPDYCNLAKGTVYDRVIANRTFLGYPREGLFKRTCAGLANNVAIVNTVKCSEIATKNLSYLLRKHLLRKYQNIDDVIAITHPLGCGMSYGKERYELISILSKIVRNPNFGSVFILGLGCEHMCVRERVEGSILEELRKDFTDFDKRVKFSSLQFWDDELNAIEKIADSGDLRECFEYANHSKRVELPLSYLTLGVKCGGSSAWSSIINTVVGRTVDKIIKAGGSAIITEIPEMDGYLHIFAQRARNKEVGKRIWNLMNEYEEMCKKYPFPSTGRQELGPGNMAGGLLNIYRKSAGACAKAGSSDVVGILKYGESIFDRSLNGLYILEGPGYDPISLTSVGLSGAQIAVFTTGLGTPIGSVFSKVIKAGAAFDGLGLKDQMDITGEEVLNGTKTFDQLSDELFELILKVAAGERKTAVEKLNDRLREKGLPDEHREFMLWKRWADY